MRRCATDQLFGAPGTGRRCRDRFSVARRATPFDDARLEARLAPIGRSRTVLRQAVPRRSRPTRHHRTTHMTPRIYTVVPQTLTSASRRGAMASVLRTIRRIPHARTDRCFQGMFLDAGDVACRQRQRAWSMRKTRAHALETRMRRVAEQKKCHPGSFLVDAFFYLLLSCEVDWKRRPRAGRFRSFIGCSSAGERCTL